jgi:nucleoside-diphosphate-sugar epimerase
MRILVTGAGGFIGNRVVGEALLRGHEVTALVRPGATPVDGARPLVADLRQPPAELGPALADADAVIHLAASTRGGWRPTLDHMVIGTENLLAAAREAGWQGRFVHVSSFAVYGLNQVRRGARVDEETPIEPEPGRRDVYAWGKTLQERVVRRAMEDDGLDAVIVRPGAVYGPAKAFQYRVGRMLGQRILLVFGGGNPMPLTFVGNTASLLVTCAEHPEAAGKIFNAVDPGPPVRQIEYARRYAAAQDAHVMLVRVPLTLLRSVGRILELGARLTDGRVGPPGLLDPYVSSPSFRRFDFRADSAREILGWTPPHTTEEALRLTFPDAN